MSFRSLYEQLVNYQGQATIADVLTPWVVKNPLEVEWLRSMRASSGNAIPEMSQDDLWSLYSVSRVFEVLALSFQKGQVDGSDWPGPVISTNEFTFFAQSIGLDVVRPDNFSPFHHEIVEVTCSADSCGKPKILEYYWPCLMLGTLLFMRAGAAISAGSSVMRVDTACTSTLYWAYWKKNRPHQDLSHGWGSNSSWRTDFRRDYHLSNTFHFNVDGKIDLLKLSKKSRNREGLDPNERMELVANRCFVTFTKDHSDQFPYEDRFSVKAE